MWQSFLELLRISRPPFWVILPLVFCLGLAYGRHGFTDPSFNFTPLMLTQLLMLTFPICLFTFGLNDIYDDESDRHNPRKTGLEGIRLDPSLHKTVRISVWGAGFVFSCLCVASANPAVIYFGIATLVSSYAYSVPPWRLKARPPLDAVTAGILGFIAPFGMGYSLVDNGMNMPLQVYGFGVCVMGFHAFSTISDFSVDKSMGDRTFAVAFGKRTAALLPCVIFLCFSPLINVEYVKAFFLGCAILCAISAIFPSERLARYFCISMFVGASAVSGWWVLTVALK